MAAIDLDRSDRLLVGMDLGTSSTACSFEGGSAYLPSAVGKPRAGLLPGLLPGGPRTFFGEEALIHNNLLDVVWPVRQGTIVDPAAAAEFCAHVSGLVDPSRKKRLYVVVGTPAHAPPRHMALARQALASSFHKVQFYPEPFLVVMGLRAMGGEGQADPALNSLVIDIGAGTTDVTVVQGMFPGQERQRSVPFAGDEVDRHLWDRLHHLYPDLDMPKVRVTRLKEQHSRVGEGGGPITLRYPVLGKQQSLDIGDAVRRACEILVPVCVEIVTGLLEGSPGELVEGLQQNIILAGGGSRIQGLAGAIQQSLREAGFEMATVRPVKDYQHLVAQGALAMARQSGTTDWQNLPTATAGPAGAPPRESASRT